MTQLQLDILGIFAEAQERFGAVDEFQLQLRMFRVISNEERREYFQARQQAKGLADPVETSRANLAKARAERWTVTKWKRGFAAARQRERERERE